MNETTIEATLKRLEEIVSQLESDEVDLESALALFEEGVKLADRVNQKLKNSELKIKQVIETADGFSLEDLSL